MSLIQPPLRLFTLVAALVTTVLSCLISCNEDPPTKSPGETLDGVAPAAITNLTLSGTVDSTATLTWVAPGDDGSTGIAHSYDIRYSTDSTTLAQWDNAVVAPNPPQPATAGATQQCVVHNLNIDSTYYFGVRTSDEAGNLSPISNIVSRIVNQSPVVFIVSHQNGDHVADLVEIEAMASDNKGVSAVDFFVDGDSVSRVAVPPYKVTWDAHTQTHGSNHIIYAVATDTDGNKSGSQTVLLSIDTILAYPPVTDSTWFTDVSDSGFVVSWVECVANDLLQYVVQVDTGSSGPTAESQTIITTSTTANVNGQDNYEYTITVSTEDQFGHVSHSSPQHVVTLNRAPAPSTMEIIRSPGMPLRIEWERNANYDFMAYSIIRDYDTTSGGQTIVGSVLERDSLVFLHSPPDPNHPYFYKLRVSDNAGYYSDGPYEQVSQFPAPINLLAASLMSGNSATIEWTRSGDPRFDLYEVEIDTVNTFDGTSGAYFLVTSVDTAATVTGLMDNQRYFYRVSVLTTDSLTALSATAEFQTLDVPPPQVSLYGQNQAGNRIRLSWSEAQVSDFASFTVCRATDSTLVFDSAVVSYIQASIREHTDSLPNDGKYYYYGVVTEDEAGQRSYSPVLKMHARWNYAIRLGYGADQFRLFDNPQIFDHNKMTLEFWCYSQVGGIAGLLDNGSLRMKITHGGSLQAYTNLACEYVAAYGTANPNQWLHIALTTDSALDVSRVYVNGVEIPGIQSGAFCSRYEYSALDLVFGKWQDGIFPPVGGTEFSGIIDEIRIWNYDRSSEQISSDYEFALDGDEPGLVGYFRLDEGVGNAIGGVGTTGDKSADAVWVLSTAPILYPEETK